MEHTANNKKKLPLWLWLCYGLLLLLAFTGSSLAGYKTTASGWDSARVAAFAVSASSVEGQSAALELDMAVEEKKTAQYRIQITNQSGGRVTEVAVAYDVIVTLPQALPSGVTMKLDDTDAPAAVSGATGTQMYTFANAGSFTAGQGSTKTHTLSFSIDQTTPPTENAELQNITIEVSAAQVD